MNRTPEQIVAELRASAPPLTEAQKALVAAVMWAGGAR
jgi:hypothetical protein